MNKTWFEYYFMGDKKQFPTLYYLDYCQLISLDLINNLTMKHSSGKTKKKKKNEKRTPLSILTYLIISTVDSLT